MEQIKNELLQGKTVLGIELGSTRIKAVLIDSKNRPIASGAHTWENRLEQGIWTYSLEDIWEGLRDCYKDLTADIQAKYGVTLKKPGAIGISAMMHGYMAFDKEENLLVPFRTWRNGITGEAAAKLTALFDYNIPQRWSIAHLYQAMLKEEPHVKDVAFFTTLAGYLHWKLTGRKVLGVGDASGMFPIDSVTKNYDRAMLEKFEALVAEHGYNWKLKDILPKVLLAGDFAGTLTEEGARLLDPSGELEAGILVCPPEGDAGTGMVATNSVAVHSGNVSAGTSIFGMVVLEKKLKKVHEELDMVTTPDGSPVAMVHANNCTSDLNAWVGLFREYTQCLGVELSDEELYGMLYRKGLEGDKDCGGLLSYGYLSGENITHVNEGRPMFVRTPDSRFGLANFMRSHLFSALAALKLGMDILQKEEKVQVDMLLGHGGLFKTKGVGQRFLAAAVNTPIQVMTTAGEGGPWGMALLASYMLRKRQGESLEQFLAEQVFADSRAESITPDSEDVAGFEAYMKRYVAGLEAEHAAAKIK